MMTMVGPPVAEHAPLSPDGSACPASRRGFHTMNEAAAGVLLPPAILAVLTALALAAGYRRCAIGALAALVLLSVDGVAHVLTTPLLRTEPGDGRAPQAIVVVDSGLPELLDPSRSTPSMATLKTLRTAAAVQRRTGLPLLVSGARAPDGAEPVADGMAASLAADFAVPIAWREVASTNLWQSAVASAGLLRGAGIGSVYLVGQPWELRLRMAVFRGAGLQVTAAPVPYRQQRPLDWTALVAFTPAWLESAVALREWVGLACQAMPACVAWMRGGAVTPGPS